MSKQKRITDSKELEDTIDRLRKRQNTRVALADELDAEATAIFKQWGEHFIVLDLGLKREERSQKLSTNRKIKEAQKLREKARRLRAIKGSSTEKRIRHFSLKLAELRTGTLPGIDIDQSVAV